MTIKIHSSDPASQGPFVIINKADFNPDVHEPFDDEARAALAGAIAERTPTVAEILAARSAIEMHRAELDAEELRLRDLAESLDERQRVLDAAAAGSTAGATNMTKDELQAALTAKGIAFPTAANKADLQALLNVAQAV